MTLRLSPLPIAVRTGSGLQVPVRPVVIVVVLPLFQLVVKQMNVVRNPVAIEELVELLVVDAMGAFDLAVQVWCARSNVILERGMTALNNRNNPNDTKHPNEREPPVTVGDGGFRERTRLNQTR